MPRYRNDRSKHYVGIEKAEGTPTSLFRLEYQYGSTYGDDTFVLFRVYRDRLSANDRAAGFRDTSYYSVADLFTRDPEKALRLAKKLVRERFGDGMRIVVKDRERD